MRSLTRDRQRSESTGRQKASLFLFKSQDNARRCEQIEFAARRRSEEGLACNTINLATRRLLTEL